MEWGNENQNSGICGKFCPPKKSLPKRNEISIATQNRGKICHKCHKIPQSN